MKVDISWSQGAHIRSGTAPQCPSPLKKVLVSGPIFAVGQQQKAMQKGSRVLASLWPDSTVVKPAYPTFGLSDLCFLLTSAQSWGPGSSVSHREHFVRCCNSPLGLASGFPWGLEWREGAAEALFRFQWNGKWTPLTGSCLQEFSCHLGSVSALTVKLLMNGITALFIINRKMCQPLLGSIVYCSAEQDSGTYV